jgi:MFS family permease
MAIALATLLFALSKGPEVGWGSPLILTMFGIAVFAGVVFVMVESRIKHPALDFNLFANRTFTASTLAAYMCYASTASVNFLMPFFLIHACAFRADKAGMILMATPIAMMFLTGPSGLLSDRVGVRLPATLGMAVMASGALLLLTLHQYSLSLHIFLIVGVIGIGAGLFTAPNNSAIMGSAPRDKQGVAGAILAAARTTGFASGVALAGVVYVSRLHAMRMLPEPVAITNAVHTGAVIIVTIAATGAMLSALRGSSHSAGKNN